MPRNRTLEDLQWENQNCEGCLYAFGMQLGQVTRSANPKLCVECQAEEWFKSQTQVEREIFTPEELERIDYMRATCRLDPDGFDTIEEIRAALSKAHPSETIGDAA